jgi:hypothetical protein
MADLGLPVRRGAALSLAVAGVLGTIGAIL